MADSASLEMVVDGSAALSDVHDDQVVITVEADDGVTLSEEGKFQVMSANIEEFEYGQPVFLIAKFKNRAGDAVDPTTVTYRLCDPNGVTTSTTSGITNPEVGTFEYRTVPTVPGFWTWRVEGTGDAEAPGEREFLVSKSKFYPVE